MKVRYTRHARSRMRRDRLTPETIESIVNQLSWIAQSGNRYRAYGDVQGRRVRVVFAREDNDEITIITAFFDG